MGDNEINSALSTTTGKSKNRNKFTAIYTVDTK